MFTRSNQSTPTQPPPTFFGDAPGAPGRAGARDRHGEIRQVLAPRQRMGMYLDNG